MKGSYLRKSIGTNLNKFSSRSHCIYTLYFINENKETNYIHLIDLAGSEKIYKYETNEKTINESKNINLSLLHLEKVFLALEKKSSNY